MNSIEITSNEWEIILNKIRETYPPSVYMIRSKMQRTLGFVRRDHHEYKYTEMRYTKKIMLDFYSENKRTLFLLTYGEFIRSK